MHDEHNGLSTRIYSVGLVVGEAWHELLPPEWIKSKGSAGLRALRRGVPRKAYFHLLHSTSSIPIELVTDYSANSPARLIAPGSEAAAELSRLPWDLGTSRPKLRLSPRHTPQTFNTQAEPSNGDPGIDVSDLDELYVFLETPISSLGGKYTIYARLDAVWLPLSDYLGVTIPPGGIGFKLPTRNLEAVYVGLDDPTDVTVRTSASEPSTVTSAVVADVTVQLWFPTPEGCL